jgi:hypothetical protein
VTLSGSGHYSIRTERAYVDWIRRYILFHAKRHPTAMGAAEVGAFLTHLAVERDVSSSTQNQALNALVFLYDKVLEQPLGEVHGVVRAAESQTRCRTRSSGRPLPSCDRARLRKVSDEVLCALSVYCVCDSLAHRAGCGRPDRRGLFDPPAGRLQRLDPGLRASGKPDKAPVEGEQPRSARA